MYIYVYIYIYCSILYIIYYDTVDHKYIYIHTNTLCTNINTYFTMGSFWCPNRFVKLLRPFHRPGSWLWRQPHRLHVANEAFAEAPNTRATSVASGTTKTLRLSVIHSDSFPKIWFNRMHLDWIDSAIKNCDWSN